MKNFYLNYNILLKLLIVGFLLNNYGAFAQKTTIWLVRHAEKADAPVSNPPLNSLGQQRAKELLRSLKGNKINAIYITDSIRSVQTAQPVADAFSIKPQIYDPADIKALAARLMVNNKGKNALIVGRLNTIIPTIEAFGGLAPFTALNNDDYDILFKLTVKNDKADLEMSYYGTPHHSTAIPEERNRHPATIVHPVRNF
jgi:hypothetical protein